MTIATDLDRFFEGLDAVTATFTPSGGSPSSITVLFDRSPVEVDGVQTFAPTVTAKSADVPNADVGDAITVAGTAYNVRQAQPDGTGLTVLLLSKD